MPGKKPKPVSVPVGGQLQRRLKGAAKKLGVKPTAILRLAVAHHLPQLESEPPNHPSPIRSKSPSPPHK